MVWLNLTGIRVTPVAWPVSSSLETFFGNEVRHDNLQSSATGFDAVPLGHRPPQLIQDPDSLNQPYETSGKPPAQPLHLFKLPKCPQQPIPIALRGWPCRWGIGGWSLRLAGR